jgi:hypothetical protein
MNQTLMRLSRAIDAYTPIRSFALFTHDRATTARTLLRHAPFWHTLRAEALYWTQDFGDYIARFTDNDCISHTHIFAMHFVFVV